MYAPKGIAALYTRPGIQLRPLIGGGGQEHRLRAGTESVAEAVAVGAAADLAADELTHGRPAQLLELRDRLHTTLTEQVPGQVRLNGHPDNPATRCHDGGPAAGRQGRPRRTTTRLDPPPTCQDPDGVDPAASVRRCPLPVAHCPRSMVRLV
jgi:hypothetical protein